MPVSWALQDTTSFSEERLLKTSSRSPKKVGGEGYTPRPTLHMRRTVMSPGQPRQLWSHSSSLTLGSKVYCLGLQGVAVFGVESLGLSFKVYGFRPLIQRGLYIPSIDPTCAVEKLQSFSGTSKPQPDNLNPIVPLNLSR